MPPLNEITLTDLNPVLILDNLEPKVWTVRGFPGMAIKRIDRSSYWVYDTANNKGVMTTGYYQAVDLLKAIASLEF